MANIVQGRYKRIYTVMELPTDPVFTFAAALTPLRKGFEELKTIYGSRGYVKLVEIGGRINAGELAVG
jgi:hypothetical protein